ncbi:MAG TPA: hypothetical protein VMC41_03670 [Candidatus Nanoarchaeia archaeon]|nr:hypothetical protein [Candidatus Nanoarchaeia archaeon]
MCEYKSDYATQTQILKTAEEEKWIRVDFNEVEQKLAETRFGYVAVFCRKVGIPGSWEILIVDDDKKQLRKAKQEMIKVIKEEPVERVFIIKSSSRFAKAHLKITPYHFISLRRPLLCKVSY